MQCSVSFSRRRGTLRGLHYQTEPYEETKLVRCTRGALYDVIVDVRPESPTFAWHVAVELTGENRTMLYVPARPRARIPDLGGRDGDLDQISEFYHAEHAAGVAWNDPALAIEWPQMERLISERDRNLPRLAAGSLLGGSGR